jgi:hypothetical protein
VTIPISKLINIHNILGPDSPFPQKIYDINKQMGDRVERGEVPGANLELVRRLRDDCWNLITQVLLSVTLDDASRTSRSGMSAVDRGKRMAEFTRQAFVTMLQQLQVEVTQVNMQELMNEFERRSPAPRFDGIRKKHGF